MIEINYLLFGIIAVALVVGLAFIPSVAAQQPQLEKEPNQVKKNETQSQQPTFSFSGKVTIPITTSEQIIIDLPISKDSQIRIVPIK
jgi:hypothetical protein